MKIILLSDDSIRLEPTTGQLTIEAESASQEYSPYRHVREQVGGLHVRRLQSWGSNSAFERDDLVIDVSWSFAEQPAPRRRDHAFVRVAIATRRTREGRATRGGAVPATSDAEPFAEE